GPRLHLVDGDRCAGRLDLEQTPERHQALALVIDESRVFLVCFVVVRARGVLQLGDRIRRPHVLFAANAKRVFAACVERVRKHRSFSLNAERCTRMVSSAISAIPTPSILLAVPVKYFATNAEFRPMASKICAPQYDW